MILANVRASLSRDDAQIALRLIARGSGSDFEAEEERLREQGLDALLDDSRLFQAMLEHPLGARISLPLFCYVMVRHAMKGVGEQDRVLADYVASVLLQFGIRARATRIAPTDDEEYSTLADLVKALDEPDARRNFLLRAHLGNYALWLSGLFPDMIEHRCWRKGGPALDYYEDLGRRGFELAANHQLAREHGMDALFREAAGRFDRIRVALNNLSDSLLFPRRHSPERLMRQVRDMSRWKQSS